MKKQETTQEITDSFNDYFRRSAIGVIVLGVIHFVIPSLDTYWGVLLVALGLFSFFVRKKITILIFGAVLVLAGVFNGLALFLGYVEPSNIRWVMVGVVQVIWGAGEVIKYFKFRKVKLNLKVNRTIEIIMYLVLASVFVFYLYMSWFYVPEYTLIKNVNGEEVEIPASECAEPYVENFNRCCIAHESYPWLCDDEGEDYGAKLEAAENVTINEVIYDADLGLSFETPVDYYMVEDTKEGGILIPYVFVAYLFDDENYTGDSIYITFRDYRDQNFTKSDWKNIIEGMREEAGAEEISQLINDGGYEIDIIEFLDRDVDFNAITYTKTAIFSEQNLVVVFEGIDRGKDYVEEFDKLINSVWFGN